MTDQKDDLRDKEEIQEDLGKTIENLLDLIQEKAEYDTIHEGISMSKALEAGLFTTTDMIFHVFGDAVEGMPTEQAKVELAQDFAAGMTEYHIKNQGVPQDVAEEVGQLLGEALSKATGEDVEVESLGVIEAENEEEAIEKLRAKFNIGDDEE